MEKSPQYDIAFEVTPQVGSWINRLSGKEKKHFQISLARLDRIRPVMEEIFARHGIPKDLVYLCLVESGANPYAVSCSGATGYWQFIPDTAKHYGLQVNRWVDERKHLEKSTEAAALYLKDLYAIFGDWLLAIAAYNAGEGAITRLMKDKGVRTFWDISHTMTIKPETIDYVPKFIATVMITKNREKYGLPKLEPESTRPLYIPNAVETPVYLGELRQAADILAESNTVLISDSISPSSKGSRLKAAKPTDSVITHTVRKGDTLYSLARKYSTTVDDIKRANHLEDTRQIHPKTVLAIPSAKKAQASVRTTQYKVKKGDTIWGISRQFDVSTIDLKRWNRLRSTAQIKPGDELTIYHR